MVVEDIEYFARPPGTMVAGTKGDLGARITKGIGRRGFRLHVGTPVIAPDPDDLALLPISRNEADRHGLHFHRLSEHRNSPTVGQTMYVVGHPGELVKDARSLRTGETGLVTHPTGEMLTVVSRNKRSLKGYDPRVHYLLDFTREDPQEEVQRPAGMSGAGVWRQPPRASRHMVWNPAAAMLAGLQTGWYEKAHLLQVTRVRRLIRLAL